MIKVLPFLCLFFTSTVFGQYNETAPWMLESGKSKKNNESTLQQMSNAFNSFWEGKDRDKKGSGFKPFKRWETHWRNQLTKKGTLATPEMIWKSWEQKNNMVQSTESNWKPIGPFTTNVKQGQGRVNTFIIDPNDPQTFYVGAPAGGLWRSSDSGINWEPLSDELPQIGVSGIAIDKNDSNIIYIATGDDDARDTFSVGVLKSVDKGATWDKTGLDFSSEYAITNEIYIHPDNSNIIWVSSNFGFYKSIDAGENWTQELTDNIMDFKLKPDDPDIIYAVSSSKFYRSVDGGETFETISSNLPEKSGRLAVEVSPANSDVVYVLSADLDYAFQGLYRSNDAGMTFVKTAETNDIFSGSTQAWFDMALTVSPENENIVIVGVLDIWKSANGGDSFVQKNRWWDFSDPAYTHADIHFLRFFNGNLFAGTDGGIYMSSNSGDTFVDLTENLSISQYYKISTAKGNSSQIAGGLQDNGGFGYSNSQWHQYHGGDGMDCLVDRNNENIYYGFTQYGGSLNITYNGGQTEGGTVTGAPSKEVDEDNGDSGGKWITPLETDAQGNIYAGYSRLYRLVNNSWKIVSGAEFGGDLDHLSIAPSNDQIIFAARSNRLFKSTNKGLNFERIDFNFTSAISSVDINKQDENTIYLTTSGLSGKVMRSTDGGVSWMDITGNLPKNAKLVVKHQNQSLINDLFLGTSIGVFHINDEMDEWEVYDTGLPNAPVYDLEINIEDKVITAGTYGRGVFQSPIKVSKAETDISLLNVNNNNTVLCDGIPVVTVKNNGLSPIDEVEIKYSIDDVAYQYFFQGKIDPEEIKQIELPDNVELGLGSHQLIIETTVENDAFSNNNKIYGSFTSNNEGEGQYINTFGDVNEDQWLEITLGNSNSLWEKAEATSSLFANKFNQAYITNADGNYTDETTSYLISPCYDLSILENPMIKFDMVYDIEKNWDVLYMEYSTDSGTNWHILGTADDPNWYNSDFIDNQRQITVGKQWTGSDLEVKEYSYNLKELNDETNVIFRFVFASDQAETGEGAAIDNFSISASAILASDDFAKNNFQLYPNPSSSVFYIERPGYDPMRISIYDVTGRLVLSVDNITDKHYPLDLSKANSGLYFLKIVEGKKTLATSLLKN